MGTSMSPELEARDAPGDFDFGKRTARTNELPCRRRGFGEMELGCGEIACEKARTKLVEEYAVTSSNIRLCGVFRFCVAIVILQNITISFIICLLKDERSNGVVNALSENININCATGLSRCTSMYVRR